MVILIGKVMINQWILGFSPVQTTRQARSWSPTVFICNESNTCQHHDWLDPHYTSWYSIYDVCIFNIVYHQKYHGMSSSKTYHHHEYSADFHDLQSHFIHFQAFGPSKGAVPNSWMASAKSCRFVWRWVFWNPKHGLCMLINSYEWLGLMVMNDGYWWLWMMVWWLILVIHGY